MVGNYAGGDYGTNVGGTAGVEQTDNQPMGQWNYIIADHRNNSKLKNRDWPTTVWNVNKYSMF